MEYTHYKFDYPSDWDFNKIRENTNRVQKMRRVLYTIVALTAQIQFLFLQTKSWSRHILETLLALLYLR